MNVGLTVRFRFSEKNFWSPRGRATQAGGGQRSDDGGRIAACRFGQSSVLCRTSSDAPYTRPIPITDEEEPMDPTRRTMVATGSATLAMAAASPQAFAWERTQRYPDPAVEVLDPSFAKYRLFNAAVERLATGMRWSEGPVWIGDGRYVLWSDIPNNRIMKWDEETGLVSEFRRPSNYANGNTRDRQGRLVTCEHGGRRVVRTEYDGAITVILDKFNGKPLNSPNDVVVKTDGSIWFTDPPFGIGGNYEGNPATPELPMNVYRVDPG